MLPHIKSKASGTAAAAASSRTFTQGFKIDGTQTINFVFCTNTIRLQQFKARLIMSTLPIMWY